MIRRSRPSAWALILRLILKATARTASAAVIHDTARIWGPRVSSRGRTWKDSAIGFGLMLGRYRQVTWYRPLIRRATKPFAI
ncbi:hypothetical protein BDR22DRAFT_876031 [Usnea florida]